MNTYRCSGSKIALPHNGWDIRLIADYLHYEATTFVPKGHLVIYPKLTLKTELRIDPPATPLGVPELRESIGLRI
jgi:hypothetical protein